MFRLLLYLSPDPALSITTAKRFDGIMTTTEL